MVLYDVKVISYKVVHENCECLIQGIIVYIKFVNEVYIVITALFCLTSKSNTNVY